MAEPLTSRIRTGAGAVVTQVTTPIAAVFGLLRGLLESIGGAVEPYLPGPVVRVFERFWGGLLDAKRTVFGTDPGPSEFVFGLVMIVVIVGTVFSFVQGTALAAYWLSAFLITVVTGWRFYQSRTARIMTLFATVATVLTVGFITYFLFESSLLALREEGLDLFIIPEIDGETAWFFGLENFLPSSGEIWNPRAAVYSLVPAIWATVLVTVIAGLVAGPLGLLGALYISEIASPRVREAVKPAIEILAGIPSIVYGFIGFQALNSFVQDAFLDAGASFFIAGIVVGIMALPTVVSVAEDALSSVPDSMGDGSVAMGATDWQTMKSISVPAAFSGISAAVILGLGRAIGETMAVAAILGGNTALPQPLYDLFGQGVTLTSRIAISYGSAPTERAFSVLFFAGVLLFSIIATMSIIAQYIERRMKRKLQGEQ